MLPRQSIGAEIGVHLGGFSRQIVDALDPKELHLIDPWEHLTGSDYKNAWYGGRAKDGQKEMDARHEQVRTNFAAELATGQVKIHRGYSTDVLDGFEDGYFDWIYIDGNHLYEFVKRDLELALLKTRSGGLITGDDYSEGGWWAGGVKKAVDEFADRKLARLVEIRHGQFIFRKE